LHKKNYFKEKLTGETIFQIFKDFSAISVTSSQSEVELACQADSRDEALRNIRHISVTYPSQIILGQAKTNGANSIVEQAKTNGANSIVEQAKTNGANSIVEQAKRIVRTALYGHD
jgi:hypothetical protein